MTFDEYIAKVYNTKKLHPEWRLGQAYFNVLRDYNEDIAYSLQSEGYDPFYNDSHIGEFLNMLYNQWCEDA